MLQDIIGLSEWVLVLDTHNVKFVIRNFSWLTGFLEIVKLKIWLGMHELPLVKILTCLFDTQLSLSSWRVIWKLVQLGEINLGK